MRTVQMMKYLLDLASLRKEKQPASSAYTKRRISNYRSVQSARHPHPPRRTERFGQFDVGHVTGQHAGKQSFVAVQRQLVEGQSIPESIHGRRQPQAPSVFFEADGQT